MLESERKGLQPVVLEQNSSVTNAMRLCVAQSSEHKQTETHNCCVHFDIEALRSLLTWNEVTRREYANDSRANLFNTRQAQQECASKIH